MKETMLVIASEPDDYTDGVIRGLARRYRVRLLTPLQSPFNRPSCRERMRRAGVRMHSGADLPGLMGKLLHDGVPHVCIFVTEAMRLRLLIREVRIRSPRSSVVVFTGPLDIFRRDGKGRAPQQREAFAVQLLTAYAQADLTVTMSKKDERLLRRESGGVNVEALLPGAGEERTNALLLRAATAKNEPVPVEKASIVLLNHNALAVTRRCVESVRKYTTTPYELILVDNASTDGTKEYLRSQKDAVVILNKRNLGFAKACNLGMRRARGKYVILLNNDTIVTPGWTESLIACARSSRSIGLVGPRTNSIYGVQALGDPGYRSAEELARWSRVNRMMRQGEWDEVYWLTGFCLLIKRSVIDVVGLLDERYSNIPTSYEDFDYCLRARAAGFRLFCANDAFVHHAGGGYLKYNEGNRNAFIRKWGAQTYAFLRQSVMSVMTSSGE